MENEHEMTPREEMLREIAHDAYKQSDCTERRYQWVLGGLCGILLFLLGLFVNTSGKTQQMSATVAVHDNRLTTLENRFNTMESLLREIAANQATILSKWQGSEK